MNITAPQHPVHSIQFEGFFYVESNGQFFKGCRRCGGTGHYSFNGMNSICYLCNNNREARLGDHFDTEADAQKWCHQRAVRKAQADRKREQERLAKLATRSAAWDALEATHPAAWALLTSVLNVRAFDQPHGDVYPSNTERDTFVLQLADQLWRLDETPYTERQIAALERVAERRAAYKAEAAETPAPAGRVVVTGEIVSARVRESDFGTSYKLLIKDDQGFKVWCSLPKAQADEAYDLFVSAVDAAGASLYDFGPDCWFLGVESGTFTFAGVKGRRITFTATLEQSRDDANFAFGSRPTKGAWI